MKKSFAIFFSLISFVWSGSPNIHISLIKEAAGHYPVDTISVYVETLDHKPLPDLQKENFLLWLKGDQIKPLAVNHLINIWPAQIMFCLDVSGTMAGEPFNNARIAIEQWLRRLPPNVEMGLCTIGNDFRIVQPFSKNRRELHRQLQALTPDAQRTELFYSVFKALESFKLPEQNEMRFLVLFSDGKNEGSSAYNIDDCVKQARQESVIIHSIGLHRIDSSYLKNLEKLSDLSGGVFLQPVNGKDIQKAYSQIYRYLFSSYFLRFNLSEVTKGTVAPLRLQIKSDFGNAEITGTRLTVIPSGFPYTYAFIIGLIIVIALLVIYFVRRKNKQAVEELEDEYQHEIAQYQGKINSYKENINELATELSSNISPDAPSPAVISGATRIIDPRVEPAVFLQFDSDCAEDNLIEIQSFPARIGKGSDCEIRLSEPTVSRLHAIISREEGDIFISDQNSTNGLWVNGQRVQRLAIKDGDSLRFGKCRCIFKTI